jgi:hypothetical protein
MTEEEKAKDRKRQYKSEKELFFEFRDTVLLIGKGEISDLLLFKINENLEKIAGSLENIEPV